MKALKFFILVGFLSCSLGFTKYYDGRPDILDIKAQNHDLSGSISQWQNSKYGQFVFLAQIFTFFPNGEYYFLARDIEYVHDIARVLFKDNPKMLKRLHLVPVSTRLSYNSETVQYLEQEGMTKKSLQNRTPVFIDSCCSGTVPSTISNQFAELDIQTQGYLIEASSYPNSNLAAFLGAKGGEIENLPHFNDSGESYHTEKDGHIRVKASLSFGTERTNARKIMEQIVFDYDNSQARKDFAEIIKLMRVVHSFLVKKSPYKAVTQAQAIEALKTLSTQFKIPASVLIQDIQSLERMNYAATFSTRVDNLTKAKGTVISNEKQALTLEVLKKPLDIDNIAETFENLYDFDEIVTNALKILAASDAKSLGLTQAEYKKIVNGWLDYLADGSAYSDIKSNTKETVIATLNLNLTVKSPLEALVQFLEALDNNFSEKETISLFKKIVTQILTQENYSLDKKSSITYLLTEADFLTEYPSQLKWLVNHVLDNIKPQQISKLAEVLIQSEEKFTSGYTQNYYATAEAAAYHIALKKVIEALPPSALQKIRLSANVASALTRDKLEIKTKTISASKVKDFFVRGSCKTVVQ